MLEVLSQNRDLRGYIKEAETMLTRVDIEKLPSYELGMEKGMEEGMVKGTYLERRRLAKGLLGLLSDEVIAEKTGLPIKTVQDLHRADE
jgi:hypothetical protein